MIDSLIIAFEKSVEKNGDIPLTTSHMLNLLKKTKEHQDRETRHDELEDLRAEYHAESYGCRD